jgi:hypothetical protein
MSFFFDVWALDGFVLASDVRLINDGEITYAHKIGRAPYNSTIKCAVAVCGEYCETALRFLMQASARRDTLRDVAQDFAQRWTRRYAGTDDYSAAHLVGFDRIPGTDDVVAQMWFWSNWTSTRYCTQDELEAQLESFSQPIPFNNHVPQKIRQLTGRYPSEPHQSAREQSDRFALRAQRVLA